MDLGCAASIFCTADARTAGMWSAKGWDAFFLILIRRRWGLTSVGSATWVLGSDPCMSGPNCSGSLIPLENSKFSHSVMAPRRVWSRANELHVHSLLLVSKLT